MTTRLLLCMPAAAAAARSTPAAVSMTADECAVWARERSFAATAETQDLAAFAAHVHPQAVFVAAAVRRGRAAIVEDWRASISGGGPVRVRWHPEQVAIGGDPDIAISRGPAWYEDTRPEAAQRWRLGTFVSTWVPGGGQRAPRAPAGLMPRLTARAG